MTTDPQYAELLQQHLTLLEQIDHLWIALVVCAFVGVLFIGMMMFLAAWSVRAVTKRQSFLEGKFELLIDVLLQTMQQRKESEQDREST